MVYRQATYSSDVHRAKIALSVFVFLFGSFTVPRDGLSFVFRQASLPGEVRHAKAVLSRCISLFSSFSEP